MSDGEFSLITPSTYTTVRSSAMLVYLAGPISGCTYAECTNWRTAFERMLDSDIECLSPMRGKEALQAYDAMEHTSYARDLMCSDKEILTRDFNDCTRADVVLANLLAPDRISIGTVMEIAWSHAARTPLVMVMEEEGNPHDHGLIRAAAGFRVPTLETAAVVVNSILNRSTPAHVTYGR